MRKFAAFALAIASFATIPPATAESLLVPADKIYISPEAPPLLNGGVLVRDGRIAKVIGERARREIPAETFASECRGVVVAGFQNSHVHFIEPRFADAANKPATDLEKALADMLISRGFTTVFDVASDESNTLALRARVDKGELRGPRIFTVGLPLFPPDGIPSYINDLPPDVLARMHQPGTPQEARAAVRSNLRAGADGTKLFLHTSPRQGVVTKMSAEIARAAVAETHAQGKLVFAHPTTLEAVRLATDVGVDVLVHTTLGEQQPWDAATLARMKKQNMAVIPTFKLWLYELAKEQVPQPVVDSLVGATFDELRAFRGVQGQVLFGTDVGYMHEDDPTAEYELMARSGMSPAQILASLTTAPAARFKEQKSHGKIAPGFAADLVVLGGDPFGDVKQFANVKCVFRDGALIYSKGQ
ncbi:MAG TPA: amidohydrolase family protein [Steroidobacteraceae bacterium]|nr:amidohydrolase family protein [Steroidobacteraceae bacterium]